VLSGNDENARPGPRGVGQERTRSAKPRVQAVRQTREQLILKRTLDDLFSDRHSDLPLEEQRGAQHHQQQNRNRYPQAESEGSCPAPFQARNGRQQHDNQNQFEDHCLHALRRAPVEQQVQNAAENDKSQKDAGHRKPPARRADRADQREDRHSNEESAQIPAHRAEPGVARREHGELAHQPRRRQQKRQAH
jgi:hypothetical protein